MLDARKVIRSEYLAPEVYSDESRDFVLLLRLYDAVFNSCKFNSNGMLYLNDVAHVNDRVLSLLAEKIGMEKEDADRLTIENQRLLLQILPELLRNKGSLYAIRALVSLYFKLYHLQGSFEISVTNGQTQLFGEIIKENTIILGLETLKQSTVLLQTLSKYILPPGYSFYIYFYQSNSCIDDLLEFDEATLLYSSDNIGYHVDFKVPDFVKAIKLNWPDAEGWKPGDVGFQNTATTSLPAIDTKSIVGSWESMNNDNFLGILKEENINLIMSNFSSPKTSFDDAQFYDVILPDGSTDYYVCLKGSGSYSSESNTEQVSTEKKKKSTRKKKSANEDTPVPHPDTDLTQRYFYKLNSDSIAIVDKESTQHEYTMLFDLADGKFHILHDLGCYDYDIEPDGANWDFYCKLDERNTYVLFQDDSSVIPLTKMKAVMSESDLPVSPKQTDSLCFVLNENSYYVYRDETGWEKHDEGPITSGSLTNITGLPGRIGELRGGTYYIRRNNSWQEYTNQLFYIKLLDQQRGDKKW